jgi:hypothetical protein
MARAPAPEPYGVALLLPDGIFEIVPLLLATHRSPFGATAIPLATAGDVTVDTKLLSVRLGLGFATALPTKEIVFP